MLSQIDTNHGNVVLEIASFCREIFAGLFPG